MKKLLVGLILLSVFLLLLLAPRIGKAITNCAKWEKENEKALRACSFNELKCIQKVTDVCCDEANDVVVGKGYYCSKTKNNYGEDRQKACLIDCIIRVCADEEKNCARKTATACKVHDGSKWIPIPSGQYLCKTKAKAYYTQSECLKNCGLTARPIDCTKNQLYCEQRIGTSGCWDWVFKKEISGDSNKNKKYYCVLNGKTYKDKNYQGKARTRCRNECNEAKRELMRCSEDEKQCQLILLSNCWDSSKRQMVPLNHYYCGLHGSWWSSQKDCQDVCETYAGKEFGPPAAPPYPGVSPADAVRVLMPGERRENECCQVRHNLKNFQGDPSPGPIKGAVVIDSAINAYCELTGPYYRTRRWAAYCTIDTIYTVTDWLFWIVLIGAGLAIVGAGAMFLTAGVNPERTSTAKKMLLMGVVGLVVAVLAKLIPGIARFFLGL